ncbi:hypothetical protein ACFY0F_26815 [Streptomyces sp. NPDC001544]|uniref:hypothetical protein n=1 Tax=Streptomyces sp. NPDC001544 TaxID=3364584 RepID=UPI003683FD90
MAVKREENPAGSSNNLRGDVLRARGAEGRDGRTDPADLSPAPELPAHRQADALEAEAGPHRLAHGRASAQARPGGERSGAVFRRFGRPHNQPLLEAIGNPRREAHDARRQAEYEAREREYKEQLRRAAEQKRAEREARRPVCASCGTRFTDERWKAIAPAGWDTPRETHPHLCDDCKQRAITAERQAEHTEREHQAVPEQKAGGTWLSRFRS